MRLLLRQEVHRPCAAGHEIAAGPDSPRRERWLWDVRLYTARPGTEEGVSTSVRELPPPAPPGLETARYVGVRHRTGVIEAAVESLKISGSHRFERAGGELWVLLCQAGILTEGRRTVGPGDALILEGDDPLTVRVSSAGGRPASVVLVRLSRADGSNLRWVP